LFDLLKEPVEWYIFDQYGEMEGHTPDPILAQSCELIGFELRAWIDIEVHYGDYVPVTTSLTQTQLKKHLSKQTAIRRNNPCL